MTLHAVSNSNDGLSDAELREKAFAYWCALSKPNAPAVASYIGVSLKQVEVWRKSNDWALRKEVRIREEREALLMKVRPKVAAIATLELCSTIQAELAESVKQVKTDKPFVKLQQLQSATSTLARITEIQDRALKRLSV